MPMTFDEIASEARDRANLSRLPRQRVESEADPDIKRLYELIAELAEKLESIETHTRFE